MMEFLKNGKYKFQGRIHSKSGIASMLLGIVVTGLFFTISILSGVKNITGSMVLGATGIVTLFISSFGFYIGIKALKEKDIFYVAPIIGLFLNALIGIILFCLYIIGLAI